VRYKRPSMATRLYGILWRWHFLAGMAAFPILAVVAVTGGLYAFQPELDRWENRELLTVAPGGARRRVDDLIGALPADCAPTTLKVSPDPTRSLEVRCAGQPARRAYIDPYRGAFLGTRVPDEAFFGVVVRIHWELLLGERGRLIIEWATSWAILLMLSGAFLWWPRGRHGGAWWLRRGVHGRQRLRDLHAVIGVYALPVLLAIAATGLFWTRLAGERWQRVAADAVDAAWEAPPTSTPMRGAPRIGYDAAIAAAGLDVATERRAINIGIGPAPEAPYQISAYDPDYRSPSLSVAYWVDAYSGRPLRDVGWGDHSALGKVSAASYPVHVGAILGLPGRIAALVAALMLAALCVTGPWMWWKRRPRRGLGVPPRARRVSWPSWALLIGLGWLLPAVGWTLAAVLAFEAVVWLGRSAGARLGSWRQLR